MEKINLSDSNLSSLNIDKYNIASNKQFACIHCKRTAENNISCIGKCVSDYEY